MPPEKPSLLAHLKRLWSPAAVEDRHGPATPPPAGAGAARPPAPGAAPAPAPAVPIESASPEGRSTGRWGEILRVQALTVSLLTKKVSPDQLFRHVVDGAADSLGADEASLMLVDGDELRVVSATEARGSTAGRWREPVRLGEGVAGLVARTGDAVLLNEGDDLTRFPNLVPKGGRIQSAVSVPLEVGGRVVGVLNANRLGTGQRFTQEDLAVLRLFAGTAALAIDQTSLLQRTQARSRALETLLSITEAFAGGAQPAEALAALMPRLGTAFHPAQAVAFLGSMDAPALPAVARWTPAAGTTAGAGLGTAALAVDDRLEEAFRRREPTWLETLALRDVPAGWEPLPDRILVIPVADADARVRCLLALAWDEPGFALPSEETRVLGGLARQIALALSRQDRATLAGVLEGQMAEARAHLVEVERLATIGQSMAGLVHDINAPLAALTTFAQLVQKESGEPQTRERAGQIMEAARRAQRLVRELLTMTRPQPPAFESVDLHGILRSAMDLERPQCLASGIKLAAAFAADVPPLVADPHRLGQVFVNLLVNARQAMDTAGKGTSITVRTERRGSTVEIRVVDDGPGIPPELRAKVFDWFFTTKPPGEGTGLGLAVSREILLAQGGNLRAEETPGGGATFVLELPVGDPSPALAG